MTQVLSDAVVAVREITKLIGDNNTAQLFLILGLVLVFLSVFLAIQAARSEPKDVKGSTRGAFYVSLFLGVLLVFAGAAMPVIGISSGTSQARTVSPAQSFSNLRDNREVTWVIRMIAFHPQLQPDLRVSQLRQLGPREQSYTFVANYHELRGYRVRDAMRMTGGNLGAGHRVSAVIFKLDTALIPANARGLIQVISDVQKNVEFGGQTLFSLRLNDELTANLELENLSSQSRSKWAWANYSTLYRDYCIRAQQFRCGRFPEQIRIGTINPDWHPLGFARNTDQPVNSCDGTNITGICNVSSWDEAQKQWSGEFGARIFLAPNLEISKLNRPYLIQFDDPDEQIIPDIGVPAPTR